MSDAQARLSAVDPSQSIIVQAPAGSGKTTLLVERYLALLGGAQAPEEILAITFTRKAAAEMRQRILRYLAPDFHTDAPHEQAALAKAKAVAGKVAQWRLLDNPQRMLIRTIDSFNHYLARNMPVASALGPVPAPADNAQAFYRLAARNLLQLVDSEEAVADDLHTLLDWRDHRSQDIEDLLAGLLSRRDQWLRVLQVSGKLRRTQLERTLEALVISQLDSVHADVMTSLETHNVAEDELLDLLLSAADTLKMEGSDSLLLAFHTDRQFPQALASHLPLWHAFADTFLVRGEPVFRKTVDKRQGFPAKSEQKSQFLAILTQLSEDRRLAQALHQARQLPAPAYADDEWRVLDALVRVLVRAAAELELVFAGAGQTDYVGLGAAALRALGDEDQGYSDLGLYLDRRIQHILVDEFQDTNWGQLHLLEKLTAGWEPGDGRTLFLVGDPMQSIYRFREAEVGLFIRSRDYGVGNLTLSSARLSSNFRAREEIVAWVNTRLGPMFPLREDIAAGAVAYAPSSAGRDSGGSVALLAAADGLSEAEQVVQSVKQALAAHRDDAQFSAAIIVRARSHLRYIIPALTRHGVAYRAVKLDPLTSRPAAQDLLAITRAVIFARDTAALLALLRAPYCGLTLADLYSLAGEGRSPFDTDALNRLPPPARTRAARVFDALQQAQRWWRRRPLRELVEGLWHRLGGPHCLAHPAADLQDAGLFLDTLEQAEQQGLLQDWNDFVELLDAQQTQGDPPSEDVRLELLTMHGAKGLEWDLVVLAGLDRPAPGGEPQLLHWLPFTSTQTQEQVLLAPLRAAHEANNSPLVELIRHEQRARAAYENQRLLYVACTRAREQLVLSATLPLADGQAIDELRPAARSLLADLWPTCADDFRQALAASLPPQLGLFAEAEAPPELRDQSLRRVAPHWQVPIASAVDWQPEPAPAQQDLQVEYNWAGLQARRTGTVLHRLLEYVGQLGIEHCTPNRRDALTAKVPVLLQAMGSRGEQLQAQTEAVQRAFIDTLNSDTGRWILSAGHADAASELPISGVLDGALVNAVIDRTFVDADGIRWIIDYKSGYHAGADLERFLAEESERYRGQLQRYRRLFQQLEDRPVKTALYLPRHGRLQEVQA